MSRKCRVSGKKPLVGYAISHAHNKTKKRQLPNLQWKRIYFEEEDRFVRLRLSTSALRTITKQGLGNYLRKNNKSLKDIL